MLVLESWDYGWLDLQINTISQLITLANLFRAMSSQTSARDEGTYSSAYSISCFQNGDSEAILEEDVGTSET
jgi:hypothetical protein